MSTRSRSIAKGVVAGLLAGIVATAAKSAVERIYPPHPRDEEPVPRNSKGPALALRKKSTAGKALHWGFGAAAGAVYGGVAEYYPAATARQGVNFGIALVAVTHDHTLPVFGRMARPEVETKRERTSELAANITYGIITETVRGVVRRMID
ncbi:MAG TPA: DUF1440 domain-containing protein [Edaphobacter sp.]